MPITPMPSVEQDTPPPPASGSGSAVLPRDLGTATTEQLVGSIAKGELSIVATGVLKIKEGRCPRPNESIKKRRCGKKITLANRIPCPLCRVVFCAMHRAPEDHEHSLRINRDARSSEEDSPESIPMSRKVIAAWHRHGRSTTWTPKYMASAPDRGGDDCAY